MLPNYNLVELGERASVYARAFGRKMIALIAASRIKNNKLYRLLEDGTELIATRANKQYRLTITTPVSAQPIFTTLMSSIWIPRGFVVHPASDAAPAGWGFPIIPLSTLPGGELNPFNLAPGTDPFYWTVGGGLGQVLLTRVGSLGSGVPLYPKAGGIAPPMLFCYTAGLAPKLLATPKDVTLDKTANDSALPYTAYRAELQPYYANSPSSGASEAATIALNKETEYGLLNAHRVGMGLQPLNRSLRGYYDSGQIKAEMEFANSIFGHYSAALPLTYRTPEDAISRDGVTRLITASAADDRNINLSGAEILIVLTQDGGVTQIGTDPHGFGIYNVTAPGPAINPSAAFSGWLSSPPHKAIIEDTLWQSSNSFFEPGFKHGWANAHFVQREQWIACGNQSWFSSNVEIPVVTWNAPPSLALTWETWPVTLSGNPANPFNSSPWFPLTDPATGVFWLSQALVGSTFELEGFDNRIFIRGRCIAVAPEGGLIWAAGVQKFATPGVPAVPATSTTQAIAAQPPGAYRLIALVHNAADQPVGIQTAGMTSVLHVYYVDLPDKLLYACNPQCVIRGVYGKEDAAAWPWITLNSPFSWRDAGTVDVSRSVVAGSQNLLKYASQWRFSPDGTRACCLRDVGAYTDYSAVYDNGASIGTGYFVSTGLQPGLLELVFNSTAIGMSAVLNYRGLAPGATPVHVAGDQYSEGSAVRVMTPIAVDYDANNNVLAAFSIQTADPALMPPFADFNQKTENGRFDVGFGPFTSAAPSSLTYLSRVGSYLVTPDLPVHPQPPIVLDVVDGVFVSVGTRTSGLADTGDDEIGIDNPAFVPCLIGTDVPVIRVDVYRQGQRLNEAWYGNPTNTIVTFQDVSPYLAGVRQNAYQLLYTTCSLVVPAYAKNRNADWMLTYNLIPQPFVSQKLPMTADLDCTTNPTHAPRVDPTVLVFNEYTDVTWLGGWCGSSFLAQDALQTEIGTTGSNPRLLYARTV
jgi:hypothetical protein